MTALAAACAGRAPGPAGGPGAPRDTEGRTDGAPAETGARPAAALSRLDSLIASGAPAEAARVADSLYFRWRSSPAARARAPEALWREARALDESGRPGEAASRLEELLASGSRDERLARRAAAELARLRIRLGRGPSALRVLDRRPGAVDGDLLDGMREAARGMSVSELGAATSLFRGRDAERGVVAAELARALALAGRADSARAVAERVLETEAAALDRERARSVAEGEIGPEDRRAARVGLILPLSGGLQSVGRLLREAAAVAAAGDSLELVVRDDSSRAAAVPGIVRDLEEAGVTAIVGPVTTAGFGAAVEARSDLSLPVISPAASSVAEPAPNAYTLWAHAARVRDLSRALGGWVPARTGLRRLALLRAGSEAGRAYEHGFRSGARRAGAWVAASGTFDPDSTTFRGPIEWLSSNRPESLLVGAGDPRTVLQMAPQLSFYGLRSALVAGTSAWGQPITVRRLSDGFPSRWISAVFADRTAEGTPWTELRRAYESRYRKELPARQLPALAYDAVRWASVSLGPARLPRRGAVARGLAEGRFVGASGRFSARPGESIVDRDVVVRMAGGGELAPPDTAALRAWRRAAERLVSAGGRRRREGARREVRRWMREHGDSVRVDSARIRERKERRAEPGATGIRSGPARPPDVSATPGPATRTWRREEGEEP